MEKERITSSELENIYATYSGKVMGYIMARVQRRADAEDLCADVFEKGFRRFGDYDREKASVSTWIYTITRNTVIDYFRKVRPTAELDEKIPGGDEADTSFLKRETMKELTQALDELPPDLQNVIVLVYNEQKTLVEVSRMTHVSYGVAKLRHQKALKILRERMERGEQRSPGT